MASGLVIRHRAAGTGARREDGMKLLLVHSMSVANGLEPTR